MPRRATKLLDKEIVPFRNRQSHKPEKRFLASFVVFVSGKELPDTEEKTIEAPNLPAAIRKARAMCMNPMVFPAGRVARIPDRNVTELSDSKPVRKYQATFEIYRLGNRSSRPHLSVMTIEAEGIHEAEKTARTIARETPLKVSGAHASDLVRCPLGNVKRLR